MLFSLTIFVKIFPASLLVLITGLNIPVLFVHHVTAILLPDAPILTFPFTTNVFGFVLGELIIIVCANVFTPSLLFAKNTGMLCKLEVTFDHAMYTLLPDTTSGAFLASGLNVPPPPPQLVWRTRCTARWRLPLGEGAAPLPGAWLALHARWQRE